MDLEPTLEKTVQEYGVFLSDVLGEKGLGLANRAFCECWRLCRRSKKRYFNGSLDDSISCGCALCRLFCTMYCLARVGPGLWRMGRDEVKSWLLEFENKAPFDRILISFRDSEWKIYNGQTGTEYIQFFQIEAHSSLRDLPILNPLPGFTGSDESFQLARKWLEDCLKEHNRECHGSQKPSPLPKRVLDLGCFPDGIRLLEDSDKTAPYICLSHCWGDAAHHPLQTTSRNISSHRKGIPFANLPKTFREAATFVRRLGYRYLWIDSLCIIQDNDEDWRVQASRMADIYQGCLLTIAAAAAANSAQGLFSHLSPGSRGVLLSDLTEQEDNNNVWIRQDLLRQKEPLDTRGWVFQERALSPRTLYFGKDELIWECLEATACQCGQPRDKLKIKIHAGSEVRPKSKKAGLHDWHSVVEEYSNLQLSHEEDVFPAISGISKQFRTLLGSQYIAGLWRDNLFSGLRWQVGPVAGLRYKPVQARRSTKWRAPSFSWANVVLSQEFCISYWPEYSTPDHQCVKLIDAHCVPVGTDDTGQLSDAYIDLEGTLVAAIIKNLAGSFRWVLESDSHSFRRLFVFPDYGYEIDGPHQIADGGKVFCLLVSEEKMDTPDWTRIWLILIETKRRQDVRDDCGDTTESIPVYERVGLLWEDGLPHDEIDVEDARPADLDGSRVILRIQ